MSRVAISEACALEECEERVSAWWLCRVVRVRESSESKWLVRFLVVTCRMKGYFLMRSRLVEGAVRAIVGEWREIH